jgi:hypothetical protein
MRLEDVFDGGWQTVSAVLNQLGSSKLWGGLMKLFAGKGGEEDDYEQHTTKLTACNSSLLQGTLGGARQTPERACSSSLERAAKTLRGPKARDQPEPEVE